MNFYTPEKAVSGPAYSNGFKIFATIVTVALALYCISIAMRFPLPAFGFGVKLLLCGAALMLALSYYWFLRARTTIDDQGIRQSWIYDKQVVWSEVRGARMIGIPFLTWLFPPRMVIRTGNSFVTFNGGTQDILIEFAKISLAFRMKR